MPLDKFLNLAFDVSSFIDDLFELLITLCLLLFQIIKNQILIENVHLIYALESISEILVYFIFVSKSVKEFYLID